MTSAEILVDAFSRVGEVRPRRDRRAHRGQLAYRLDDEANTIGWLVWHLSRVQDDHVAAVAGVDQVWNTSGWAEATRARGPGRRRRLRAYF